jgi:hypothetical protein
MLNRLGKLYKRVKSDTKFQNEQNEQEDVVISSSDYDASDTNPLLRKTYTFVPLLDLVYSAIIICYLF